MKAQLLVFILGASFFSACGHKESVNDPTGQVGRPVNGSYGDAGIAAGAKASPTNTDTNLLRSPSNTLHRVAE